MNGWAAWWVRGVLFIAPLALAYYAAEHYSGPQTTRWDPTLFYGAGLMVSLGLQLRMPLRPQHANRYLGLAVLATIQLSMATAVLIPGWVPPRPFTTWVVLITGEVLVTGLVVYLVVQLLWETLADSAEIL